jgi:CBS domain-containing protein
MRQVDPIGAGGRKSMSAGSLAQTWVFDAMRHGVLSCQPETPLSVVARMMAEHRVHAVVVTNLDGVSERAWGIVSDVDVLRAAEDVEGRTAGEAAATEPLEVSPEETLERAAQLMAEHEITHLIVVSGTKPIGVISSLDVARVLGERVAR